MRGWAAVSLHGRATEESPPNKQSLEPWQRAAWPGAMCQSPAGHRARSSAHPKTLTRVTVRDGRSAATPALLGTLHLRAQVRAGTKAAAWACRTIPLPLKIPATMGIKSQSNYHLQHVSLGTIAPPDRALSERNVADPALPRPGPYLRSAWLQGLPFSGPGLGMALDRLIAMIFYMHAGRPRPRWGVSVIWTTPCRPGMGAHVTGTPALDRTPHR